MGQSDNFGLCTFSGVGIELSLGFANLRLFIPSSSLESIAWCEDRFSVKQNTHSKHTLCIICCKWRHILFHGAVLSIPKVSICKRQMCCKQGMEGNEQRHDEAVRRKGKMTVAQLREWDSD